MKRGAFGAAALACACLLAPSPAAAQEPAPEVRSLDGIRYVSGGITTDERDQLAKMARDFNLKLVFAETDGDYLADVQVVIVSTDERQMLTVSAEGPILMARLPAGTYRIAATAGGKEVTRSARVTQSGLRTMTLRW